MNPILHVLLDWLIRLAAAVIALTLAAYTPALLDWTRQRIKNRVLAEALAYVEALLASAVRAKAAEVRDLKDPAKPGAWTPAAAEAAMLDVLRKVSRAAPAQLALLQANLGAPVVAGVAGPVLDLPTLLRTLAEAQVEDLRHQTAPPVQVSVNAAPRLIAPADLGTLARGVASAVLPDGGEASAATPSPLSVEAPSGAPEGVAR